MLTRFARQPPSLVRGDGSIEDTKSIERTGHNLVPGHRRSNVGAAFKIEGRRIVPVVCFDTVGKGGVAPLAVDGEDGGEEDTGGRDVREPMIDVEASADLRAKSHKAVELQRVS